MLERIYKLQPDRTLSLRGFDTFAAAASIHDASASGFTVSGTFRDPADFAVAVLYDADNFYEHPRIKYLPDFDFSGLTLTFNLQYSSALQPIDSPKYNWIDWATLDCVLADGTPKNIYLRDNAMLQSTDFPAASASVTVQSTSDGIQPYDRLTLWFQNLSWDYISPPGHPSAAFPFFSAGAGKSHSLTINGRTYSHTETGTGGEASSAVAGALIAAVNAGWGDPDVTASVGSTSNSVLLTVRSPGVSVSVSSSDGGPNTLYSNTTDLVAAALTAEINSTAWVTANPTHALLATCSGSVITVTAARYGTVNISGTQVTAATGHTFFGIVPGSPILLGGAAYTVASVQSPTVLTLSASAGTSVGTAYVAPRGGHDGNLITLLARNKTNTLTAGSNTIALSGGRSDVTWQVTIDFSANGCSQLRQCWLTFAPALTADIPYIPAEWQAVFSNWTLTGDEAKRRLQVAGPGSVRIEENDSACTYIGTWTSKSDTGFFSKYYAKLASTAGASVTVKYSCQFTHDLYVGTSLATGRGDVTVHLDGSVVNTVSTSLTTSEAISTRRLLKSGVAAGSHSVTLTLSSNAGFYFDFLEAAVLSDIPTPLAARTKISPALDFDTDHTYKLPPARIHWIFDQLGYAAPMNEYLGVFWWNERKLSGGSYATGIVNFAGTWAEGDYILLPITGTSLRKDVLATDDSSSIATHFAAYINEAFVGAIASTAAGTLTIQGRSPSSIYTPTLGTPTVSSAAGTVTVTQSPVDGTYGDWMVDDAVSNPLNRAARDWHADLFALCAARGREITSALSMELVLPPDGYVARYPDGSRTAVSTGTVFGSLTSNHCAIGAAKMIAYQAKTYLALAALQAAAGLTPSLQFGEFLWWFFASAYGMGFYDDETLAAARTALGRDLHVFLTPNDDPTINSSQDAIFLRNRLRDHVAALASTIRATYPTAKLEVLYPDDVNHPTPVPTAAPLMGGSLINFINLPIEWTSKSTSGLDRIKVEALAFSTSMRNLDLAKEAIALFPNFGWPKDSVRYLTPVFGIATPWHREVALAFAEGLVTINLWAYDHICLYNLDVPEKALERRSFLLAA